MEFHISRKAREKYQFDQGLFSIDGDILIANFQAARVLSHAMNLVRGAAIHPEQSVSASHINAMGLIDEIFHYVFSLYKRSKDPEISNQAFVALEAGLGPTAADELLQRFIREFPPTEVFHGQLSPQEYLQSQTRGIPNKIIALEEMILLWIADRNPALKNYSDLFSVPGFSDSVIHKRAFKILGDFFKTRKKFGPEDHDLLGMLRTPARMVPDSLPGQLAYIRQHWADLLGEYLARLIGSMDFLKEEGHLIPGGPGAAEVPLFDEAESEPELFSPDKDWMPRLVLIAKNIFVWLDQLSRKYQRSIQHLDQIPNEELDHLARQGFSGLWLIGLWERSRASARIKQLCGNPDAISSAYSLASYSIAADLGGCDALQNLRQRAWQRGIRLASDMVPNHMGIDSAWVMEHPEWFLQLDHNPYPSHTFNGIDLSSNSRASVYLEDHYYDHRDAAVEFKWIDNHTGQSRYIYHGNDGTNMPWNDTAQLNYLVPQVRETVIQAILEVARSFPIIRFDAAMTLAKKHYQRLWFPEPGYGGAIPTRSDFSLTREQFDRLMPKEFWREVVDRVSHEAPDTLLLAEAFWLMEGYFVRSLGMHRVYNSAFMNMLRDEENANYRQVMKNTLEFDPEILRRYVNFMNNPDELTAAEQFGKGDKYFGICTLMVAMPGLPMFGHGQVEGFSEKYGMEFRKALWDEQADEGLVERHERQIFPLLRRRSHFADIRNFLLYDFHTEQGVNEDVFVFSNRNADTASLIAYNNKFNRTHGWIHTSVAFARKSERGNHKLVHQDVGKGIGLQLTKGEYVVFHELNTNLDYLRPTAEIIEKGLELELQGYQALVFLDFRQVHDDEQHTFARLCHSLGKQGVPDLQAAIREIRLQPVLEPFLELVNPGYFSYLIDHRLTAGKTHVSNQVMKEARQKIDAFLAGYSKLLPKMRDHELIGQEMELELAFTLSLPSLVNSYPLPESKKYSRFAKKIATGFDNHQDHWWLLLTWLFVHNLGRLKSIRDRESSSLSFLSEWQLEKVIIENWQNLGLKEGKVRHLLDALRMMVMLQNWYQPDLEKNLKGICKEWLATDELKRFLQINLYEGVLWFNREAFNELLGWLRVLALVHGHGPTGYDASAVAERALLTEDLLNRLAAAGKASAFQVDRFLDFL
jgi:glycosidase